jgi:hypothetical protein
MTPFNGVDLARHTHLASSIAWDHSGSARTTRNRVLDMADFTPICVWHSRLPAPLGSASGKCLSTRISAGIETHNERQPNWKKSCQIRQTYSQENRSTSLISNHHDVRKMEDETRVLTLYFLRV